MTVTSTLTFQGDTVKCSLPKKLYLAIAKIQVSEGLGWEESCLRSAELMNTGSEIFGKRVSEEAKRLHDSELMQQINKARKTIKEKAFQEGLEFARQNEINFKVPCAKCGKPMRFSDRDLNWEKSKAQLLEAFSSWNHIKC